MTNSISILEQYTRTNKLLADVISELIIQAEKINLSEEVLILKEFKTKIAENIFRIIVIGEFKRGKSTFINAMLGNKVMPVGVTPTTATVNVLKYAEEPYVTVHYKDATEKNIDLAELNNYVTTKNLEAEKINTVNIFYPAKVCKERVEIIDSPGVNDIDEQRVEITYDFIPKCDAAIFIMNSTQQLSASEREFLTGKVNKHINKIFFILNKIDQLDESELEESFNYVKSELANFADNPKIYPVSAKKALNSRIENNSEGVRESKIEDFESALFNFLMDEKGKIILATALHRSVNSINKMKSMLELKLKSYHLGIEEIKYRLETANKEFKTLEADKKHILDSIDAKKQSLIDLVKTDCHISSYDIAIKLEKFINDSNYKDSEVLKEKSVKFLENTIQEWGKKEEEIIQSEINQLLEYISLKTSNIQEKINKIKFDFLGSETINVNSQINIDPLQKNENIFDMLPKFFGREGGEFSGIARGALFIFGASILTGGAIIPALLLGSSASFITGKVLNNWTENKEKKFLIDNFKTYLDKIPEMIIPQLITNLQNNFEKLKANITQEIDSIINTVGKALSDIENEKNYKESETYEHKKELEEIMSSLNNSENKIKEISDGLK